MDTNTDFEELLACFHAHHVEFVIVGGYAVAFHGAPRYTQDIDLCYQRGEANARAILAALADFGFGSLDITVQDLLTPGMVIQLGQPPNRVDLINDLSGIDAVDVWSSRVAGAYGKIPVFFIGKEALQRNKAATGRHKDLGDLDRLPPASAKHTKKT